MDQLLEVMARLRDPDGGCPWDVEQTFETIAPYTIEEAYEVADAIHRGDAGDLQKELGDLLLQVVYHARMAEERGWFRFEDVASAISAKMIDRHPHVFADATIADAKAQSAAWEAKKKAERAAKAQATGGVDHVLADVPLALPALKRAQKIQSRVARVGFDWPDAQGAMAKVREELTEIENAAGDHEALVHEVGDLLFACVNLARHVNVAAEEALQAASRRFERRFGYIEDRLAASGQRPEDVDLDRLEALWQAAKASERP
ncbi:MAG: nucleoside triphosphate pyrophosphohydrolase [Geminicoccaceae bacterium]|nr:MAG: nucleoside triphosphate pyrophosphohydrolase [Geminicoccaceae bacterium]